MNKLRLAILGLLLIFLFGLGILLGIFLPRWSAPPRPYTSATLLVQVKTLSQLVTVQYIIEKVIVLEDVKWVAGIGENRVLMVAHGIVKAGLDLGQLQPGDLEISGKTLVVRLPPAQITDAYLDEKQTRVIERSTGLIRAFDKDLEQTARQNAITDINRAARNGGILKDAEERARVQLTVLFLQMGFEKVEFKSR
jgi:hypothetical protein